MEKYYLTTAIAYSSSKPHIGNTYEIVLSDVIARYKRLQGYDVYFQTGTDEHGFKIQQKAEENNEEPQKYVDEVAKQIQGIWDIMNTTYDSFVRTSDPIHKAIVQKIFKKLYDQGDIYLGKYEGWYCIPDESFYTESQLVDGKCPECGREVKKESEEAYFFKLSNYQERLLKHIEENPDFIQPESRKNEMINNFMKPGLDDLCVSRTSFNWGVNVDFDPKHVVYVWIDALANYITFLGYDPDGNHSENFKKYWPADVHIIGKDIIRFHTIYWPIILMALDVTLPKTVYGHPWLLMNGGKMSKSLGNIIYADDLVRKYGVDAIRYYVLSEISFANDGTITEELITEKYNSDLANTLGNLVNRTISMAHKYFFGKTPTPATQEEIDTSLINNLKLTIEEVNKNINEFKIASAINSIFDHLRKCNKYIDETTPWILAKEENYDRLSTVIYNLLENIRVTTVLLQSFIPETATKIFEQLNTSLISLESIQEYGQLETDNSLNEPSPLFVRIEDK